jgi:tetratricopeptide (TPR) repeat protein
MKDRPQININELLKSDMLPYQFGMEAYYDKKYEEAILYFNKFLDSKNRQLDKVISAYYHLSKCYFYQNNHNDRLRALMKSFQFCMPRAEVCCEIGYCFMDNDDYEKAMFWFELATKFKIPEKPFDFFIEECWGYLPHLQLCVCYDKLKNIEKAIEHNKMAIAYNKDLHAAKYNREYFSGFCNLDEIEKIYSEKDLLKEKRNNYLSMQEEGVSIIVVTNKPKYIKNIFENYSRANYRVKELIIILNNKICDIEDYKREATKHNNVRVFSLDESCMLGWCLNFAINEAIYSYISKMDDDDYYATNYINDLMNVFKYTNAEITGKRTHFIYFEDKNELGIFMPGGDNMNIIYISGATILAKKEVFKKVKFKNINVGEDVQFFADCYEEGIKVYSSDKYNYVYMKHNCLEDHTWKINSDEIQKWITKLLITQDFKILSVV